MIKHRHISSEVLDLLWPAPCCETELSFHAQTGGVGTALFEARQSGDWDNSILLFDALYAARHKWDTEPFLSILDHAYVQAAAYLADWCNCEHDYERGLKYVEAGWLAIDQKNTRRKRLGMRPSRSSAVRMQLLWSVSDMKWRLGPQYRNVVLAATDHAALYGELSAAFRMAAANGEMPASDVEIHTLDSIWAGLWVSVACLFFAPATLSFAKNQCNWWHRQMFDGDALGDYPSDVNSRSLWFWHYQIAALWKNYSEGRSSGSLRQFMHLFDQLESTASSWPDSVADQPYMASITKDRDWICRKLREDQMQLVG